MLIKVSPVIGFTRMYSLINVVIFSGEIEDKADTELLQSIFVDDMFPINGFLVAPTREFDLARGGKSIESIGIAHNLPL
jgi:hypothetical protein